ncbi:hypothetical protein, partial [Streptomyces sp. T21Q-yed]|uniref:hypothetical protein n=1 Tax=Streptomyces sp. T21Q-yed TaxID=3018441 RepID=UPI0023DEC639
MTDLTATTGTSHVQVSVFRAQARYVRVTDTGLPSGVWASIRSLEVYDRPFSADAGTVRHGRLRFLHAASGRELLA